LDHRNNFNLLRLLAACQVVFMHSYAHLHLPTNELLFKTLSQFPGVACFFVISGFLVSDSCLRSDTKDFFAKRALRIYPGLIVNILVLECLVALTSGIAASPWTYAKFLPVYLITASEYFGSRVSGGPIYAPWHFFTMYPSGVLWTLTVELSFYLVLPLVLWAVSRLGRAFGTLLLLTLMAVSFAIARDATNTFYETHHTLNITVAPYFWVFGIGMVARLWWDRLAPLFVGRALWWVVAYAALSAALITLGASSWLEYKIEPGFVGGLRITMMGGVVLSAAYTLPSLTERLRLSRVDFSYGLYLWHMLVVSTLIGFGITGHWWLWPIVYVCGLSLAELSWFFIERQFLRLKPKPARQMLSDLKATRQQS
jgi:peptidoglycan/LPS O-acetylase OafA/YrhL